MSAGAIWGLTDGSAGMVAQVRALAAALGRPVVMKTVRVRKTVAWLPNAVHGAVLRPFIFPGFLAQGGDDLTAPWPELVVSCGRRAGLVAAGMRAKRADARTRFIHIQDPQMHPRHFDVVVAMAHDRVQGPNVIKTVFALHCITPERLAAAGDAFGPRFASYPAPRVGVLLGGSTNKYRLRAAAMDAVIAQLQGVLAQGCSLLITPSRRTGEANIAKLAQAFAGDPRVYLYDFTEENPYMGLLACADMLVVSNDSVNMMSEAHATGKPLYLLALPGHRGTKPARFAEMLQKAGAARPLGGAMESWPYPADNEMERLTHSLTTALG